MAVSYTHLDVYKRQVGDISDDGLALDNGLLEGAEAWLLQPARRQSNIPTAKTVSYTHLDVYKRQVNVPIFTGVSLERNT